MAHQIKLLLKKGFVGTLIVLGIIFMNSKTVFAYVCPTTCNGRSLTEACMTGSGCEYCEYCNGYNPNQPGEKSLGELKGLGPLGDPVATEQDPGASAFTNFVTKTIGVLTVVAFIWFIFVLFTGAISWLSSGGDKAKLQEAQKKITTSLVGLIIVISAIFLVKLIGNMFGIDILDLTTFIKNL